MARGIWKQLLAQHTSAVIFLRRAFMSSVSQTAAKGRKKKISIMTWQQGENVTLMDEGSGLCALAAQCRCSAVKRGNVQELCSLLATLSRAVLFFWWTLCWNGALMFQVTVNRTERWIWCNV